MGSMKINFAEVEGSFDPLPEGPQNVLVEKVEVRESKSSEHNYLNWELVVQDGEFEDRRLWMITSLSPKALFRLKDVLVALDVIEEDDEIDLEWDEDIEVTPTAGPLVTSPDLAGIAATAIIKNEIYENKERNRVDDLRGAGETDTPQKKTGSAKPKAGGRRALR